MKSYNCGTNVTLKANMKRKVCDKLPIPKLGQLGLTNQIIDNSKSNDDQMDHQLTTESDDERNQIQYNNIIH